MNASSVPVLLAGLVAWGVISSVSSQEVLLQEGFNTDGEAATPPRYTMGGRDVFELQRIQDELALFDQKGPIYWEHSFNVSYVGNPTIPGRRAIFTWRGVDATLATEELLELFDSTIEWLLNGKSAATIVVHPTVSSIQGLADRMTEAGHTVVDDDNAGVPNDAEVQGDLFIHGPGASNPSRFVLRTEPVLVINAPDYDDMLVGSIGTAVNFEPGQVTIAAAGHPAVGGKTGSFDAFTGATDFELTGSFLPSNAVVAATVTRVVPPSVSSLADVDAMIAGTKQNENTTEQHTALDFADGSTGQWFWEMPIPGGYTGNWGLRIEGQLNVSAPGTYRFAVGSDDGARLRIDADRNGITSADTVIEDPGPHAHQIVYANVEFAAAGNYDFELIGYNSGGGGSLEFSVGVVPAAEVIDDNLDSGYWELVGQDGATGPVTLQGQADVTAYMATGENVERQEPLVVLLNGPNETPPGAFYDGGPFSGFEGEGFLGASGLNKWPYPEETGTYRYVRLNPVNVAGRTNVRVTVALAATVVDFETSDFIDIMVYTNGLSSTPVQLAHFRGVQDAVQPWLGDELRNFERRLTRQFADFSYDVPAGATELIVEIRVATSWWTEIAAIDNVRITAGQGDGGGGDGPQLAAPTVSGGNLNLTWTAGQAPFLVQWSPVLPPTWVNVLSTSERTAVLPLVGPAGYFRVQGGATATVKLFKATLTGANEVPAVDTPATGVGVFALEGNKLSYYVSYTGLKADATAAHIHGPAGPTESASPLFDLVPVPAFGSSGVLVGTRDLTAVEVQHLEGGMTYANIHTSVHQGGEIRGQVVPAQ